MQTTADKTQANQSQAVAHQHSEKQVEGEGLQFADNRPEAIAQRKLQEMADNSAQVKQLKSVQAMADSYAAKQSPIQKKENKTGLPDHLKSGVENLSGYAMDDVKVHYNSDKPGQLQAHAYAQGTDIHVAPGQEKHLAHEAWHVVQQKQGRVNPTTQLKGNVPVNDNPELEKEADTMGNKSLQLRRAENKEIPAFRPAANQPTVQRIGLHDKAAGTARIQGVPALNGATDNGNTAPINVAGYMFTGPMYELNEATGAKDKIELITNIASSIGGTTHPTNDFFLSKNQLETQIAINQTIPQATINATLATAPPNPRNIYRNNLDPYILKAPGKTKDNEKLVLHYQFGRDSYGYIVKIEQEGKSYTMHGGRGQAEFIEEQKKELRKGADDSNTEFDKFSSAHDTDSADESISDVAMKDTTDKELTLYPASKAKDREKQVSKLSEKSKRLDAVAKIGGEGARWVCVREQALAGKLSNGTRFYTKNFHDGGKGFIGMTFQVLWGCWGSLFGSGFNIANATVVEKLLDLYDESDDRLVEMTEEDITDSDYLLND